MTDRNFGELVRARWADGARLCVGLDIPVFVGKFPATVQSVVNPQWMIETFVSGIVRATCDQNIVAYKPNEQFYKAHGGPGITALENVCAFIHQVAPEIPVILDCKIPDIGKTNDATMVFATRCQADAVTAHSYLGREALDRPTLLQDENLGVIVLDRTSNEGAKELQDLPVPDDENDGLTIPLFQRVAHNVSNDWVPKSKATLGLVAGATYPEELKVIRDIVGPEFPLLVPGVGAQGGTVLDVIENGGDAVLINVSSAIMGASKGDDFAEAAGDATAGYVEEIRVALRLWSVGLS